MTFFIYIICFCVLLFIVLSERKRKENKRMDFIKTPRHSNKARHNMVMPMSEEVKKRLSGIGGVEQSNKWAEQTQPNKKDNPTENNQKIQQINLSHILTNE